MKQLLSALIFAALFFLYPAESRASCVGLGCTCEVTGSALTFGTYNPLAPGPLDAVGNISVRCSALVLGAVVSYDVALSPGMSGVYGARAMQSGGDALSYNLYLDAARSQVWGDGTGGTGQAANAYLLDVLFFRVTDFPVYGRLPAGQNAPAGAYSDTLFATVIF